MNQFTGVIVEIIIVGKTFFVRIFSVLPAEINAEPNAVAERQNRGHVNTIVRLIKDSTEFTRESPVHFGQALKNGDAQKTNNVDS